jgi:3-isopropylmalate/(R)-2-methylmalate dehydratase small subunit
LFYDWRYEQDGTLKKDFVLNNPKFKDSKILLARDNFGCGSSREHAVWALEDFGFEVIISSSFADIFYNNCFKNGVLPIRVNEQLLKKLFENNSEVEIDLEKQIIKIDSETMTFDIEPHWKKILLEGLDDIAITLKYEDKLARYEKSQKNF